MTIVMTGIQHFLCQLFLTRFVARRDESVRFSTDVSRNGEVTGLKNRVLLARGTRA